MGEKKNGLASLIIVIFAVIGVACATLILVKKLKERKLVKDSESFDDLEDEDYCDCDCCCEEFEDEEEPEEKKDEESE